MEYISQTNPANPINDALAGKTGWVKDKNSTRGYSEVNDKYIENVIPNTTVIPSALSRVTGDLSQGGQINGFDPHKPGVQILFDGATPIGKWGPNTSSSYGNSTVKQAMKSEPTPEPKRIPTQQVAPRKAFVDPAAMKPVQVSPQKTVVSNPECTIYLHVPGMKIPFKYHEIIVNPEKNMLVLVFDTRHNESPPVFDENQEGYLVFSLDNYPNILFCNYYGQMFDVANLLRVTLLVIEGEENNS